MILKAWGDWKLFQSLLKVLSDIGKRHGGLSISNVASRWVLDHSFVGAILVGESIFCSSRLYNERQLAARCTVGGGRR